jgi:hypothetical protein
MPRVGGMTVGCGLGIKYTSTSWVSPEISWLLSTDPRGERISSRNCFENWSNTFLAMWGASQKCVQSSHICLL